MDGNKIDKNSLERLAVNGDLLLAIGQPVEIKLMVTSATLDTACDVFKALLGTNFAEGQINRSSTAPQLISLPEDGADVMRQMCSLLHGKPVRELEHAVSIQTFEFAVVVDNYGCAEYLRLQSQGLLLGWREVSDDPTFESMCNIVTAAFLLCHEQAFAWATKRLIMDYTEKYSKLLNEESGQRLPYALLLALKEKRSAVLRHIVVDLPRLGVPVCDREQPCNIYDAGYIGGLHTAFGIPVWPPELGVDGLSITYALERMRNMGTVHFEESACEHTGEEEEVTTAQVVEFAKGVEDDCQGICLDCVRDGRMHLVNGFGKEEHDSLN